MTKLLVFALKVALVGTAIVTLSKFILIVARIWGSKWLMGSNISLLVFLSGNFDRLQSISEYNDNALACDAKMSTIHCTCVERFGIPLVWNEIIVINCNVIQCWKFCDYHQFLTKEYCIRRFSISNFPPDDSRINGKIKLTDKEVSGGKMNFNVNASFSCKFTVFILQDLHWRIGFPFTTSSHSLPIIQ
jgi:hypothetical protein